MGKDDPKATALFDLGDLPDDFFDDPYKYYKALRSNTPIYPLPDGSYLLTRYADLAFVYRDKRFSSDKTDLFSPKFGDSSLYRHHTTSLVFRDPPYHDRVRRLMAGALMPKTIKAMTPSLQMLIEKLLLEVEDLGEFDLVEDFAIKIPIEVIGNLLRIPATERGPLRRWSLSILGALEPVLTETQLRQGNQAVDEFCDFLASLVAHRRRHLITDGTDLLSTLIVGEDGNRLTEEELFQNCIFLLNAGHETTSNLIANGVYQLLIEPASLADLRQNPNLTKSAIEEMLRFQSPNQLGNRQVIEEVTIGDVVMPIGTQIVMCIGAANRDPEQFPHPDRFDIRRHPNSHLAFVTGIHMCMGMSLARLEGQMAIGALVRRFPKLRLVGDEVWQRRARFRGFERLPVAIR